MPGPTPAHAHVIVALPDALSEVCGTRSALKSCHPHRSWRDTRAHPPYDPARRTIQHPGRHRLNGTPPPRHGLL